MRAWCCQVLNYELLLAPALQWTLLDRATFTGGCTLESMSQAERQAPICYTRRLLAAAGVVWVS